EKSDAELKVLFGRWRVEKAEKGGKDVTEQMKAMKLQVREGGQFTTQLGNEKEDGSFAVDPSKTPKQIDIKLAGGPNKGKTLKGIYKLDRDTLIVCYQHDAKGERPTEFESKENITLITYKRDKK